MFHISLASQPENTIFSKRNGPILSTNILLLFHSSSIICKIKSQPLSRVPRACWSLCVVSFSSFVSLHFLPSVSWPAPPTHCIHPTCQFSAWNTFLLYLSTWRRFISASVLESSMTSPCPHRPSRHRPQYGSHSWFPTQDPQLLEDRHCPLFTHHKAWWGRQSRDEWMNK